MDKKLKNEAETKAQIIMNYYQSKNYELAIANAKKLLKKFPNYVFLFNIIGLSLQAKKNFMSQLIILIKPYKLIQIIFLH